MAKVLVLGEGGRERALGWSIEKNGDVSKVLYSSLEDSSGLYDLIEKENVDLVVVGSEEQAASGLVDSLRWRDSNLRIFGPGIEAIRLESDKFFSYDVMEELGIPQAESIKCDTKIQSINGILKMGNENGVVIKARGLTKGRGVSVCDSVDEAFRTLNEHAEKYGEEALIAKRLYGDEFSVFGISNGHRIVPIHYAFRDHKRLLDGDEGPNTGGMGAFGPVSEITPEIIDGICENIMNPVVRYMRKNYREFIGFLYAGMIMTDEGAKVLEFNVRMGDPECQPAMMLLEDSIYEPISLALGGRLDEIRLKDGAACCVVLASKGYPENPHDGFVISGLDEVKNLEDVEIFQAGTVAENGNVLTKGGRILGVTAYGNDVVEARDRSYKAVSLLDILRGFQYRGDIAENERR